MKKKIVLILGLLALALFFRCIFKPKEVLLNEMPNKVVFILVDTLRAQNLPFYGYEFNTAPFLNSLQKNSILFKNFYSTSSYTAPSTASLFTSLYQNDHGVKQGFVYSKRDSKLKLNRIPQDVVTLGEMFKESGYNTFAVSDNLNISEQMGFNQGFDEMITNQYVGASKVNKIVLSLKDKINNSKKSFLYIHYMDPHSPYNLQKAFARKKGEGKKALRRYDSEISYVDDAIKKLYKAFKWDKDTLIIFTADHGEAFGERVNQFGKKERGHGKTLNREVIKVPLFFYMKGLTKKVINFNASHVDVLPTLASLLNFQKKDYWKGDDLSSFLISNKKPKKRYLYADLQGKDKYKRPDIHSVIFSDYHYILTQKTQDRAQKEEFFSWKNDKLELKSNIESDNYLLKDMRSRCEDHFNKKSIFKTETLDLNLDKKTRERLSTLGYIN